MAKLGVNIDHIATLRQARRESYPDPVEAAIISEKAGCDSIVCHLREDRRHIQDRDLELLRKKVKTRLNLEMSIADEIVDIACGALPDQATIVPEKRREITTEGGLKVSRDDRRLRKAVEKLKKSGIDVSLFIDPEDEAIRASKDIGVTIIELHTGRYAGAKNEKEREKEFSILTDAISLGKKLGLQVNAGHGLDYENVTRVAKIPGIYELNIGFSIVARSVFTGLEKAVRDMKGLIA